MGKFGSVWLQAIVGALDKSRLSEASKKTPSIRSPTVMAGPQSVTNRSAACKPTTAKTTGGCSKALATDCAKVRSYSVSTMC